MGKPAPTRASSILRTPQVPQEILNVFDNEEKEWLLVTADLARALQHLQDRSEHSLLTVETVVKCLP